MEATQWCKSPRSQYIQAIFWQNCTGRNPSTIRSAILGKMSFGLHSNLIFAKFPISSVLWLLFILYHGRKQLFPAK